MEEPLTLCPWDTGLLSPVEPASSLAAAHGLPQLHPVSSIPSFTPKAAQALLGQSLQGGPEPGAAGAASGGC